MNSTPPPAGEFVGVGTISVDDDGAEVSVRIARREPGDWTEARLGPVQAVQLAQLILTRAGRCSS